jgi:2-dehydro-3-deoxygalactonokinase
VTSTPRLIALDWGTTNLHGYRLGDGGAVIDHRDWPLGIMQVADGNFAAALERALKPWQPLPPEIPILASGMIGSRQGWKEVPYAACPAGLDDVARALAPIEWAGRRVWLVPGASCSDRRGTPDVMRGEEAQIFGAASEAGSGDGLFVIPGTHSKWVMVQRGRIARFATFMTGEMFAVLKGHSILGRMMQGAKIDAAAFRRGVGEAQATGGRLLHSLFGVRALGLFGKLPEAEAAGYLSGLLIGAEFLEAPAVLGIEGQPPPLVLIGQADLALHYGVAAGILELPVRQAPPQAAAQGLWRLANVASLVKQAA